MFSVLSILLLIFCCALANDEIVITHEPDFKSTIVKNDAHETTINIAAPPVATIHVLNSNSNANQYIAHQTNSGTQETIHRSSDIAETSFALALVGVLTAGVVGAGKLIFDNAPKLLATIRTQ